MSCILLNVVLPTITNQQLILQTTFRAGTWNVRGMNRPGKVETIVSEAAAVASQRLTGHNQER